MSLHEAAPLFAALALGLLVGALFGVLRGRIKLVGALRHARRDAAKQSRATVRGQVTEQLAPLAEAFRYPVQDARFLGAPIDYIVFEGLSAGDAIDIVFVEVKTGKSQLSARERRVRDAVKKGRVRYEELRL